MLFLKGVIIGIGKIIPGVSGSVIAISLGLYEKGIDAINNYTKDIKGNTIFLLTLGSGVGLAIIFMSGIIKSSLALYYLPTMIFFIGLISGGLSLLFREVEGSFNKKNIFIFIIVIVFILMLNFLKNKNDIQVENNLIGYIVYFAIGIIDAGTMIIPGISGTAILILLGCYNLMLELFSSLSNINNVIININFIFSFVMGLLIGILIFVKLINYLFTNHKEATYWAIVALAISSLLSMFITTLSYSYYLSETLISAALFIVGYKISESFSTKLKV